MRVWRLALHTRVRVFTLCTLDTDERQRQDYGAPQIAAEISQLWHYIQRLRTTFSSRPSRNKAVKYFCFRFVRGRFSCFQRVAEKTRSVELWMRWTLRKLLAILCFTTDGDCSVPNWTVCVTVIQIVLRPNLGKLEQTVSRFYYKPRCSLFCKFEKFGQEPASTFHTVWSILRRGFSETSTDWSESTWVEFGSSLTGWRCSRRGYTATSLPLPCSV